MKKFLDKDFLLSTESAKKLYHKYAADMPIIDYHCHVSPKEIYEDRRFENITELWLSSDPYKHRLMRICGIEEHFITGDASDYERFEKFCARELFGGEKRISKQRFWLCFFDIFERKV